MLTPPPEPAPPAQPEPPVGMIFGAFLQDGAALLKKSRSIDAFLARLETYRLIFPDRYGHVVAFTDGIDQPTEAQIAEILAKASAKAG